MSILLFGTALLCTPAALPASVVRGRVIHNGQPQAGVAVALRGQLIGQSDLVRTGSDGLFTLTNIPAGSYILRVWPDSAAKPLLYRIQVREPQTDILPVNLP